MKGNKLINSNMINIYRCHHDCSEFEDDMQIGMSASCVQLVYALVIGG